MDCSRLPMAVISLFYKTCMDFTLHLASVAQPITKWFQSAGERRSPRGPVCPLLARGPRPVTAAFALGKGERRPQASGSAGRGAGGTPG